jgi:6-phosphofructokinase 1
MIADGMRDLKLESLGFDASGNRKLPDVGKCIKDGVTEYCKDKGMEITLKYIDPTYMIRTVPANSYDSQMCS